MPVSINPIDLFRIFGERGIRERDTVAVYLENIANVATALAECWAELYQEWIEHDQDLIERPLSSLSWSPKHLGQWGLFYEASEYYRRASKVLGED